jgi:putative transposase
VRFAFIAAEKAEYPVHVLCRVLQVTRSGFYAWRRRPPSAHARADAQLALQVRAVHAESRATYGRLRLQRALRARGIRIGDKRVRRLMRADGLVARGRRRFRVTTDAAHRWPIVRNQLKRRFRVRRVNRVWAADITALPIDRGWCYLAVVLDLASRRVVGWATAPTLHAELAITALQRALTTRRVQPGLVHHSDRGSQYASDAYQRVLAAHRVRVSMSRAGDCWDNAPVESFFSGLKAEATPLAGWGTYHHAQAVVADHLEFYNRRRLHSTLGYRSPADFEAKRGVSQ